MFKKLKIVILLTGLILIILLVVDKIYWPYKSVTELTGWQLSPFTKIKTLKSEWHMGLGQSIWELHAQDISKEAMQAFSSCREVSGLEINESFPETKGHVLPMEKFCQHYKEQKNTGGSTLIIFGMGKVFVVNSI